MKWIVILLAVACVVWLLAKSSQRPRMAKISEAGANPQPTEAQALLKQATALKRSGDLVGATEKLKAANVAMQKDDLAYPVSHYLRLPMYLQEAGRPEEAWQTFSTILFRERPAFYTPDSGLFEMDQSLIFDKMRLFLQREGKMIQAFMLGLNSLVQLEKANLLQKHEACRYTKEGVRTEVAKLLRKADRRDVIEEVTEAVWDFLQRMPGPDYQELQKAVYAILR